MAPKWKRLRDCYDGRDAVIKEGAVYVPDLPGGDASMNKSYRARGNFFNATKRTVQGMVGGIFQEAPEVSGCDENYLADLTLTNVSFEMFASDIGRELMLVARAGVLIDMPALKADGTNPDARPYCIAYKAEDIINWRAERRGGDEMLVMVVLKELVEVPDEKDPFVNNMVVQYRVLELKDNACVVQLWREQTTGNKKEFSPFGGAVTLTRRGKALDFVPFLILGATHATPDLELPLLLDLADVNLGHWRNSVDHEWGLHLVALPTPWVAGVKGQPGVQMKIGPSVVWELDVRGTAGMLEFSGSGLASLVIAMTNKEKQMAVLGARLLEDQAQVQETASAVKMRHADEHANLRTVAGAIESGLTLVLQMMTWWSGTVEKPIDSLANVELNKEYLNVKATPQEVQVALTALQAGEISFETWWALLSSGGWAREGIDAAAERKTISKDKALAPEPVLDENLSPADPSETQPVKAKTKTISDANGNVKYKIKEE